MTTVPGLAVSAGRPAERQLIRGIRQYMANPDRPVRRDPREHARQRRATHNGGSARVLLGPVRHWAWYPGPLTAPSAPNGGRHWRLPWLAKIATRARLFEGLPPAPDPLEASTPIVELTGWPAADTRHVLAQIGRSRIADTALTDLIIGASEAVNNALLHGEPSVTVRIWATPDRIVVSVHDPGPADPLAGLVPAAHSTSNPGLGLWVMHQLDIDTALIHTDDGFTVRLRAGTMSD